MAIGAGISQKQTAGMSPEHLLGKAVLKMNLQELQEFVQTEFNENPALVLEDDRTCPVCGSSMLGIVCPTCGSKMVSEASPEPVESDDWQEEQWSAGESPGESDFEPLAAVATPCSLEDHLKEQIRTYLDPKDAPVAEFMVDLLDEDGYLREPLLDIANRFHMSVPQTEVVLFQLQSLDPPGIAARTLQECLLIQLRQVDADTEEKLNAEVIIRDHWDSVTRMKLDEIAGHLKISRRCVEAALLFVRERLNPHPASMFRDPWQTLTPRGEAKLTPDLVVRQTEAGLVAEVVDAISSRISLDEAYSTLFAEMSKKKNGFSETDRERVRESVLNARSLIEALEFRKSALRTVAEELVRSQSEFFLNGPEYLKPMTKKQLAQQVGLHESTICRATDNKSVQLPSGEVISFDVLFDSALPVKEMVRKLAAERTNGKPLSDGEIAERLQSMGIQIARRTVAKYRNQLRVLSQDYRLS